MAELGTIQAIVFHEPEIAEFSGYYTRTRRGRTERVRKRISKKEFKENKREYLKRTAFNQYKKGKPGLLEKAGIIPNRKTAKYGQGKKFSDEELKARALKVYKKGKPGLLEKAGRIPNRRAG